MTATIIQLDPRGTFCISCQCPYDHRGLGGRELPAGPSKDCADERCPCHAVYWMTVPETIKRQLWGDR